MLVSITDKGVFLESPPCHGLLCVPQTGAWMMEHPARTSHAALPRSVGGSGVCSISRDSSSFVLLWTSSLRAGDKTGGAVCTGAASSISVVVGIFPFGWGKKKKRTTDYSKSEQQG